MPPGVRSRLARTSRYRRRQLIPREITLQLGDGLVLFARQDRVLEVVSRNVSEAVS